LKKTKIIDLLDEEEDRNRELFKFKIINKNAIQDLKHYLDHKISEYHDGDDFKDRFVLTWLKNALERIFK